MVNFAGIIYFANYCNENLTKKISKYLNNQAVKSNNLFFKIYLLSLENLEKSRKRSESGIVSIKIKNTNFF